MTDWNFKKYSQWWTFSIANDSAQFDLKLHGGAFRKLNNLTLLEVAGRWDRKGITLHDDDYLELVVPDEYGITDFYVKMDEPSATALRNYITNIPETHYNAAFNFNNSDNNNNDPNSLTEYDYISSANNAANAANGVPNAANADPDNDGNNANNNPAGGSRSRKHYRKRKTLKGRSRNRKTRRK